MRKPLSTVCFELARHAAEANHELLAYILRMAAGEALAKQVEAPPLFNQFAGVFDWEISGDVVHTDHLGSQTFGVDPVSAAMGIPIANYLRAIHPEDIGGFLASINQVIVVGGAWSHEYRVVQDDRVRWIAAQGHVTLDKSGRPIRFPGALFDISRPTAMPVLPRGTILN